MFSAMSLLRWATARFLVSPDMDRCAGDVELRQARDVALKGDWSAARELLVKTGKDWDRRTHRVDVLASAAASRPRWLRAWLDQEPTNPDAKVVVAWSEVHRAWTARGAARAGYTSREAFSQFFSILAGAGELCQQAVDAAPDDPTPWVTRLWLAIGQEHSHEAVRGYWQELTDRDPVSRIGHNAALQYWCHKWHGSHELMYEFARQAAAAAPAGSPLALQPLQAHFEYVLDLRADYAMRLRNGWKPSEAERSQWADHWRTDEAQADLTAALESWPGPHGGQPTHALAVHDRSVLAFALVQAQWWPQAAAQFQAMGRYGYEYPWYYEGDPAKEFVKARAQALRKGA